MEISDSESSSSPKPQIAIRRAREKERLQRSVADLRAKIDRDRSMRRRVGVLCRTEVVLSNILEGIVDNLMKDNLQVSYLLLKPVNKKETPDYLDIIKRPMDLSVIKNKVRGMEYRSGEEFRHDIWQITYIAHQYNDGRNPSIFLLADQLLELCDYLLEQKHQILINAEAAIGFRDA